MLVVRVELHSAIDGTVTEIANMIIHNTGKAGHYDNPRCFDYEGLIFKDGVLYDKEATAWSQRRKDCIERTAHVTNYPQRDSDGKFTPVWHLIANILKAAKFGW